MVFFFLQARPFKMTDALRNELLDAHNNFRRSVEPPATNMLKMSWDNDLEYLAIKWVEGCKWGHDSYIAKSVPGSFTSAGQNGYAGGLGNMTGIVNAWHSEVKDFIYGSDTNSYKRSGPIGHYTAVVWAESYKLGCGGAYCDGSGYFFCNYGPPGNWANKLPTPYNKGTRSADCLKDDGGLCDCGDMHCNSGKLDPKTCTCKCPARSTSGPNCQWTGYKCEDHISTKSCKNYASGYGGQEKFCKMFSGWTKSRCYAFCGYCCEDRISTVTCEAYAEQNTKYEICQGKYKGWGKDKCYKMCGYC